MREASLLRRCLFRLHAGRELTGLRREVTLCDGPGGAGRGPGGGEGVKARPGRESRGFGIEHILGGDEVPSSGDYKLQ